MPIYGTTPDATTGTKGKVQLAGDLSGTADSPQIAAGAVGNAEVAAGAVVQVVNTASTAYATGTTQIPHDDTIPQNTEGTEFMTLAITPRATTNILVIEAKLMVSHDTANRYLSAALFQDTTAGALAATSNWEDLGNASHELCIVHTMTAGTTSATTFKIRAGASNTGNFYFNGVSGARIFGAITKSSIVIWEYKV